jgi:hypothetical protein
MMDDLSLHILDIAENAVAAGASRVSITVLEDSSRDILSFRVRDNGRGMPPEERRKALDPFFSTKGKKTGLGLPLLAHTAALCEGEVTVKSAPAKGTTVEARFRLGHVDRPPLTKMAETIATLVFGHPEVEIRYRHTRDGRSFAFHRSRARCGIEAVSPADILTVRRTLREGLKEIGAG